MSPQAATAFLAVPPVRGFFSVLFLILLGGVPFQDGDLGIAARLGLGVVLLLLGAMIWTATLAGFLRDVREPRRLGEAIIVANRPRRLAIVVSWIALVVLVVALLSFGLLAVRDTPAWALAACFLAVLFGLPVATVLPWLSRRYADGAGVIAVSPQGLTVVPDRGEALDPVDWSRVGLVLPVPSAAESLVHDAADGIGPRVRWRPGARAAVARWAKEGFAPTAAEVRALRLEPAWSPDPAAHVPDRAGRWGTIAMLSWACVLCALLAGALLFAVFTGDAPWWMLLVLGWAPALGLVILASRLWRVLGTDEQRSAEVTDEGWLDHLHGQGLVHWRHIDRIEVHDRYVVVIARVDAPPFRDRDLGNRLNHRVSGAMAGSSVQIPSAGPLFLEIGTHFLPYPPAVHLIEMVERVERIGAVDVLREPTAV